MFNMKDLNVIEHQEQSNAPALTANEKVSGLTLIAEAMSRENLNIEVVKELVALQHSMEDRDARRAFNEDFSKMMQEIPVIAKTGWNDFQKTQFAKLEDIVEITRPILSKYGFSITYKQNQQMLEGAKAEPGMIFCHMEVTCVLKHRLGHEESNSILLPIATIKGQTAIQAMGAGSTYGRRYTLMQALNIATAGSDNDGSPNAFAQTAASAKKPISTERLKIGFEKSKDGKVDFMRQILDKHELTEEQKDLLNGLIFSQEDNNNG